MQRYIVGIDQSTQGTKAILVDQAGEIVEKTFLSHRQIISENGWVSHDGEEIYRNTVQAARTLIAHANIDKRSVAAIGISNQRETTIAWDRETGRPVEYAIVWQCARAKEIADSLSGMEQNVRDKTGIPLSPYFPAAKAAWILQNNVTAQRLAAADCLCVGTMDSWLIWKLTGGKVFRTDYSNASRTQLFNLHSLCWDRALCDAFSIPLSALAQVEDSNGDFGQTTLEGFFEQPVPIRAVMGDSHAALYGQGCLRKGMAKATYGTGSSIMMQIGPTFKASKSGLATSLAWGIDRTVSYVLEGNIHYSGSIITWLQKDLGLISEASESGVLAEQANPGDRTYLVPAFSGLGAPYWRSDARAMFCGMSRTTGRAELVKAGLEAIAYQVTDVVKVMEQDTGILLSELRVDGGPTANPYLMQIQSDLIQTKIRVPKAEELSAIGAAYLAGLSVGVLDSGALSADRTKCVYSPQMEEGVRNEKWNGWKAAIEKAVEKEKP